MQTMQSKTAPDVLKSDDMATVDGCSLVNLGYCVKYNPEAGAVEVTPNPNRSVDRIVDLDFVRRTVEQFGFSLRHAEPDRAVFYRD